MSPFVLHGGEGTIIAMLALAAVISSMQLTGAVPVEGGDYLLVPFQVPAGTVEMTVAHDDGSDSQILDWGVWSPDGFRGWGGGLTDPAIIGVAESSRGYVNGAITPGEWTLVIGKAKLGGQPGQYTVNLEFRDAATIPVGPRAPWTPVTLATERRWYAGDFHVHSSESGDAPATLDMVVDLARSRGLDFVVMTEHNTTSQIPRMAARQATLTDLLLVRGAEVTTYAGHATAVGTGAYVDHRVGLGGVNAPSIIDAVEAQGGIVSINHPALDIGDLCIGCGWNHADTPWERVSGIEIQTGNADLTAALFTPRTIALWDLHEDAGHHIAAIGGSDDHRAGTETGSLPARIGSPTTMVLADGLSEQAIIDGVRAGRTVVRFHGPEDPMVVLVARDTQSSRQAELGDTLADVGEVALEATIEGGDGAVAELWKDGVQVETRAIAGAVTRFVRPVSGELERYRVEVTRDGNRLTVTSHVYVDGDPSLAPGGGCCDGGAGGAGRTGTLALALMILVRVRAWPKRRRSR
jgi:hypothetical protein